jgi:Uma2 family endonuclease
MYELGLIRDFEHAEIIDGELIRKMGIGERHAATVNFLNRFFAKNVADNVLVCVQNPLRLTDFDEPEPDIVLADLTKYDGKRHPRPAETLLVVEVADASLKYDRGDKLSLYGAAMIPEVWIVNLPNDLIEVYQDPDVGIYQTTKIFRIGEIVVSQVLPDLLLRVEDVLT